MPSDRFAGKPQPYVSQQLGLLRNAGVIDDEKDGLNVYYRLADAEIATWLNQLFGEAAESDRRVIACPCPKCATEPIFLREAA